MTAEERQPDSDESLKDDALSSDHSETDWGADWESAFQAEDDQFFSDSGEDFFLDEEDKATDQAAESKQQLDDSLQKSLQDVPRGKDADGRILRSSLSLTSLLTLFRLPLAALSTLVRIGLRLFHRFSALSVIRQVIIISGTVAVIIGATSFFFSGSKPLPEAPLPPGVTLTDSGIPIVTPPGPLPGELSEQAKKNLAKIPPARENFRRKWPLPSFLIPARDNKNNQAPLTFVQVDITLIVNLPAGEEPPGDKEAFVRDIIYQFFINRPLSELRHYSLARGEMQRNLRAWLQKQWPDSPIEAITFNRYQLS